MLILLYFSPFAIYPVNQNVLSTIDTQPLSKVEISKPRLSLIDPH